MTPYQRSLLRRAEDYWHNGHHVPLDLFALMASEGMDVETLEAKHINLE